jgi:hypothetical protein
MKKVWLTLVLLCIASVAWAAPQTCITSGIKNADAAVATKTGWLCGVLILTDGTNDATVVVYDNASAASGTELFKAKVSGAGNFGGGTFEIPIRFSNGIYADVTGTGATYIIYYNVDK